MVMARIHIICGNCGAIASDGSLVYERGEICEDNGDTSVIKCTNCATIHQLQEINE